MEQQATALASIEKEPETDTLTGAYSAAAFTEKAGWQLAACERELAQLAMLVLNLDGFSQINLSFGRDIGDQTLIEITQKLRSVLRQRDLIGRLGDDTFAVCMRDVASRYAAEEKARQLCALLHKSFSLAVQTSVSIGIAVCPEDGETVDALLNKAMCAMRYVKATGKDNFAFYKTGMDGSEPISESIAAEVLALPETHAVPKRRMLIVDDNEMNRDFLSALFADEFIIDTAAEGTAALIRMRRYGAGISVVLLDLQMPGMDGFTVLQQMRNSPEMQAIPVIVVSGMNERETSLQAIKCGASDYITKPVDADLLELRVQSVICKAENEQLRAQNSYLAMKNAEARRLAEAKAYSDKLAVALHAAESADIAKSQFLSSMSHEIRTPLNAVIGYILIARSKMAAAHTDAERRAADMKVLDCLTKSEIASKHLLTIINDVLDISAIESGKIRIAGEPFDFKSLISAITVLFFSQARAKGVNFEVLFDKPTEEWFVGDQMRINQILTNLLSNAVKFTPEGGDVTLTITQRQTDAETTVFSFTVSDTGIGMSQEYLTHIWSPFEQAEASISRRFGGTGLGLSITKNLVELMHGSIRVESQSGVGSRFTVELPLLRTSQMERQTTYDFTGMKALVVDDEISTCDYIKLLFDRCGASCVTVTSGAQAIEKFSAEKARGTPFNLCLIDWRMPEMDGLATIKEIRRIAGKELPIIVVTAYDFSEISDMAEKAGVNQFISKPLFQSSLFDLLANVGGKRSPKHEGNQRKYDFKGIRILLAEDNNMNMEIAKCFLSAAGLAVDSAWNGQEAVDIFTSSQAGAYKAILMDVHMPVLNGHEATRQIRASGHPDAKTIPIIAMTADAFAEDVTAAHQAGMNDHIAKPIDTDVLFEKLLRYTRE